MRAEIMRFLKLERERAQPLKLRRREIFEGYRFVGPTLCQDVQ